jgi:mono/diheme cytochrome c family protein
VTVRSVWSLPQLGLFPPPLRGRVREGGKIALLALCIFVINAGASLAQTAFTPRDESPEDFPAGAGREETFYACTACHGFKLVAQQGLSRAGWEDSINLMIRRHNMPPLDEKDRAVVLGYLEAAYPPRAPASRGGWQNPFSKQ